MDFSMCPKFFLDPNFLHMPLCKFLNVILIHICPLWPNKGNNKTPLFLLLGFLSRLMTPLYTQMGAAKPYDQHFKLFWSLDCLLPSIRGAECTFFQKGSSLSTVIQAFFRTVTVIKKKNQITSHLPLYGQHYDASFLLLNKRRKETHAI